MVKKHMNAKLSPEERAAELLKELSLDEKMAQVNTLFPYGKLYTDFDAIRSMTVHGIGEVSNLETVRAETLDDVAEWQRKVQTIIMENSPHHIPAIFHMEGLCGGIMQGATSFPSGLARGAGFDPKLEEQIGETVCRQEAAVAVGHILAPVLDVCRDPRMGRQGESYGEDPALCAALGAAYVKGIQKSETAGRRPESVAKHFLAFHTGTGGIHGAHSQVSSRELEEVFGKPFQAAISESGLKGIMPCYCIIDGEPASASKRLLTDLLRDKMGFNGLAVSDYGGIGNSHNCQHLCETIGDTGLRCMEAGMDIEMPSTVGYGSELKEMFADGRADMEIVDQAVMRVLTAKFRMGLFEHPFALAGEELQNTVIHEDEDRALTLRSARQSLVLLKNDGTLPLNKPMKKLAVIGPHAGCARKMFGGYTHVCMMESTYAVANSIAGVSGSYDADPASIVTVPGTNIQTDEGVEFDSILKRQKPGCRSLLEELQARLPGVEIVYAYGYPVAGSDESCFEAALKAIKEADVAILSLGGKYGTCSVSSMGEGVDAANINLPSCQDSFIREAAKLGVPLVGVHFDGRPISSDTADEKLSAILECWSPAEAGAEAVADVLLGTVNPSGKLPVTVARSAGQLPIYYNHPWNSMWHQSGSIGFLNYVDMPHTPRYYFGYGLSYSTFSYSDLNIDRDEVEPYGTIDIYVTVENTGKAEGTEIVQLYLCDEYADISRPVKELAGFCRVPLKQGERKRVKFTVQASQMAFLDRDMRWKVEKGIINVQIGASSEDIRLTGQYRVINDAWINGRERGFFAHAETSPLM